MCQTEYSRLTQARSVDSFQIVIVADAQKPTMHNVSPVICSPAGVASINFLNRLVFGLVNQKERAYCSYAINASESGFFNRHLFYTYIACYNMLGHNHVCYNTYYIASYQKFQSYQKCQKCNIFSYITCYIEKNPVHCNICYVTGYITIFCYLTDYITQKDLNNRLYMPQRNTKPFLGCHIQQFWKLYNRLYYKSLAIQHFLMPI